MNKTTKGLLAVLSIMVGSLLITYSNKIHLQLDRPTTPDTPTFSVLPSQTSAITPTETASFTPQSSQTSLPILTRTRTQTPTRTATLFLSPTWTDTPLQTASPSLLPTIFSSITPTIRNQGSLTLYVSYLAHDMSYSCFDLDEGKRLDISNNHVDLCLLSGPRSDSPWYLQPMYGAEGFILNNAQPIFQSCYGYLPSFNNGSIPDFQNHPYTCILTNDQRLAVIIYISMVTTAKPDGTVKWEYLIWNETVQP